MEKTTDLFIKKINSNHGFLIKAKAVLHLGTFINSEVELTREQLIYLIESGDIVRTINKDNSGVLNISSIVNVIVYRGSKYLRSDYNNIPQDSLESISHY